jgi:predicted esterase
MKKPTYRICSLFLLIGTLMCAQFSAFAAAKDYTLVVEAYDWGPNVSKVIIGVDSPVKTVDHKDFTVSATRFSSCVEIPAAQASGSRSVVFAYVSDPQGKRVAEGSFVTLVLAVAPNLPIASPIFYSQNAKCRGNNWIEYKLNVKDNKSNQVWDKEKNRIIPLMDQFDLSGKYKVDDSITLSYAVYAPQVRAAKSPLIIWLHGGGEGGTDPSIAIIGNKVVNYAAPEIQSYFGGTYVLAPQCPGAWMHNKKGVITHGKEDDMYNQGLLAMIKNFVRTHPEIDQNRIYVGGCSNGGYMALRLILADPNYFAAGYISALAYQSAYITDQQINSIRKVPIWFVHSKDDGVTIPEKTVVPVYQRLKAAGAPVHFTFYDHVTDLSGFFGGENYHFNGHWSWIYSHANTAKLDFDGNPVKIKDKPVTIMEWMAAQKK